MANNHTSLLLFTVQGILASLTCGLCCFIYAYCYNSKLLKDENRNLKNKNKRNISKLNIDSNDCSIYKKRNIEKEYINRINIKDSLNKEKNEKEIIKNEQSLCKNETVENNKILSENKLKNSNKILYENKFLKISKNIDEITLSKSIDNKIDNEKLIHERKNLNNEENNNNKIILCNTNQNSSQIEGNHFNVFNDLCSNKNIKNDFRMNDSKRGNENGDSFVEKSDPYITLNEEERKKYSNVSNNINKNYLYDKLYLFENNKETNVAKPILEESRNIDRSLDINKNNACILSSDNITHIMNLDNFIISSNNDNNSNNNIKENNPKFHVVEKGALYNINQDNENILYLSKHKSNEKSYITTLKDKSSIKEKENVTNKSDEQNDRCRSEFLTKKNLEKYKSNFYYNSPKENKNCMNELEYYEKNNNEMKFKEYENIDNSFNPNNLNYCNDTSTLTKYNENILFKNYKKGYLPNAYKSNNSKINKIEDSCNFMTYQNKNNLNNSDPSKYKIKSSNIFFSSNSYYKENLESDNLYYLNNSNNEKNNKNINLKKATILHDDIDNYNNNNNKRSNCYNYSNINSCYNVNKIKDLNTSSYMHSNFINFDKTNKIQHKLIHNCNDTYISKSKRKKNSLSPLNDFINKQNSTSVGNNFETKKNGNDKNNNMLYTDEQKWGNRHTNANSSEIEKEEKFKNTSFNEYSIHNLPDIKKNILCGVNKKPIHNNSNIKNDLILHSDSGKECINRKIIDDNICISEYKYDNYFFDPDIKKIKSDEKFTNYNRYLFHKMNSINDYISSYNSNCNIYNKFEDASRNKHEHQEKENMKNKENNDFYFLTDENIDESVEKKSILSEHNSKDIREATLPSLNNIINQEERELHFKKYSGNLPVVSANYKEAISYEKDEVRCDQKEIINNIEEKENELTMLRKEKDERDLKKKEIDEYKRNSEIKEIIYAYLQNSKNEYNLKNSNKFEEDIEKIEECNNDEHILRRTDENEENKKKNNNKNIGNSLKINLNNNEKSDNKSNYMEDNVKNEKRKNKNYYVEKEKENSFVKSESEKEEMVKTENYEKDNTTYKNRKNNNDIYLKNKKNNSTLIFIKKEQKKDTNIVCENLRRSDRVKNEKSRKSSLKLENEKFLVKKKKVKNENSRNNNRTIKKEEIFLKKKKISKTQPVELKVFKEKIFLNEKDKLEALCQKYNTIDENRCASGFANFLMQHIQKIEDTETFDNLLNFTLKLKDIYEMKTTDFIEAFLILETIDISVIRMYPIKEWILVILHYLKGSKTGKNLKSLIKSLKLDNIIISNVTASFYMNKKHIKIAEEDILRILTVLSDVVIRRSSRIKKSKDKQNKDEILGSCWHPVNTNITISKKKN